MWPRILGPIEVILCGKDEKGFLWVWLDLIILLFLLLN